MAADVACPGCGARLKVPESMLGKKAKCKKCGRSFLTPGQTANGDSVGESQFLSTIDTPLEALPADAEFIPSAEAIEEDSPAPAAKVQPPPSANLYNPTSPAAKSSSKPSAKQPPPAPLTPKPAFGSAKAPAVPVQPAMPPAPAKSKPAAAAGPLSKAPARPTPPQKELEALPLDEVLPLDEALPLDDQPARATAPPGDSALPEDSFSFTTVPPPDKEGRKKARVREENQDEEPRPRKKKTAREEEEADPLATPFEGSSPTVATASPFSFDAGPGTTAKGISGKRDRDEEDELQPSRTKKGAKLRDDGADLPKPTAAPAAAPTSDDPFAFSAGPDPDEEESRGKRNRRAPDDDDEDDRREDRRYHREGEKKSNAPLLIAGAVGLLAVLVCMGGGIVYLLKKTPETAKKPDEKAGPPVDQAVQPEPAKENAPKKDAPKKDLGKKDGAVKDAADPTPKRSPKAGVDPGTPAVAMLALPAALTKYDFRPVGTQLERVHEAEKTKPLVDAQYEKVKRFFPPFKAGDNDTLVVWESNPGFNGSGVKYTVEVHSGSTGSKVGRFEFDGDGQGLKCDVSRDGKAFAAAADGKVTVWNLADRTKTLDAFEPYADKPDHKKAGLAAVYIPKNSATFLTVSTAGALHLFETASKKQLGEYVPAKGVPGRVADGKNVAVDENRTSVVVAVGGSIYQVSTADLSRTFQKIDLGGEPGRSFGIAVEGTPGRIAYAIETDTDKKKDRALLLFLPRSDKPTALLRWQDAAGEPTNLRWSGIEFLVAGTSRGAVWFEFDSESDTKAFQPLAMVETPDGKALFEATDGGLWHLIPAPGEPKKSLVIELSSLPGFLLNDLRDAAAGRKPLFTLKLDDKGLSK